MSLIFLKNDDWTTEGSNISGNGSNMKPYRWKNQFTTPIKIAPNSQVAYIKSLFHSTDIGDFEEADEARMLIGIPQLNVPIPLPLTAENVPNLTEYVNSIGLDCNLLSNNDAFNHIFFKSNQQVLGQNTLQDEYETGFNWILKDDRKVAIRCVQRGVNDVFNQGFNNLGQSTDGQLIGAPNGINIGTGDDTTLFNEARLITINPSIGNLFFGSGGYGISAPNSFYAVINTPNFYCCNSAFNVIDPAPEAIPPVNVAFAFSGIYAYDFTSSVFPAIMSSTAVKKNVSMDAPPTANGGGHATIADNGSGGYANIGFPNSNQNVCNTYYPATLVPADRVGFTGILPCSFGVHSIPYIDNEFDDDIATSRQDFILNCDLNDSGLPQSGGSNPNFTQAQLGFARYILGVDIQIVSGRLLAFVKVLDPEYGFGESQYINASALLDIGELSAGFDTNTNTSFGGGLQGGPTLYGINTQATGAGRTASKLHFRFRWTSPYTMCVEYTMTIDGVGTTYEERTDEPYQPSGTNQDPTAGWVMLYDMKNDPTQRPNRLIPMYLGGMRTIYYPAPFQRFGGEMKGYYDTRFNYRGGVLDSPDNGTTNLLDIPLFYQDWDLFDNEFSTLVQDFTGGFTTLKLGTQAGDVVPEEFDTTGNLKMNIKFLVNEIESQASTTELLDELGNPIFQIGQPVDLHIGRQLGLTTNTTSTQDVITLNNDILGAGTPFIEYGYDGSALLSTGNDDFTIHFQLTNFPIQSQNGVRTTQNKTIAVVNKADTATIPVSNYNSFTHSATFPLWIDLNNYGELNVNGIDVLVSDDKNKEAKFLKKDTSLVVAFRAKPKSEEGYIPDNIPVRVNM